MTATNKYKPSKRLKTWHRAYLRANKVEKSLRRFARERLSGDDNNEKRTARDWLAGKGVRP